MYENISAKKLKVKGLYNLHQVNRKKVKAKIKTFLKLSKKTLIEILKLPVIESN